MPQSAKVHRGVALAFVPEAYMYMAMPPIRRGCEMDDEERTIFVSQQVKAELDALAEELSLSIL